MNQKHSIEARLERSLANQVRARRLDRRFDSAVWARIEAQEHATVPAARRVARATSSEGHWMLVTNVIGFTVAALLVVYFGLRMFSPSDIEASMSGISFVPSQQIAELIAGAVSVAAVAVGLMFTPIGRRVRAEFS